MRSALKMSGRLQATIIERTVQTPDVITLKFTTNEPLVYQAGQCVTVYFEDTDVKQGKAYSLSSCPLDPEPSITVKKIGLFSGKLHKLKVGDNLTISSPYGFLNNSSQKPLVALAAGVGIAPIWSIIRNECNQKSHRPIALLYSNKINRDIVFRSDIDNLVKHTKNFNRQYFITRETTKNAISRRINIVQDLTNDQLKKSDFLVCGSLSFVRNIWRQLIEAGVDKNRILTETFFEAL
jgi:ferredoxin-NADP reductase